MTGSEISLSQKLRILGDMSKQLWSDMVRLDLLKQASAMAYVTLISIVPSLAATFTIISIFKPLLAGGTTIGDSLKNIVLKYLAEGTGATVAETLDRLISNLSLTEIGVTSFTSLLISLILLLRQIEQALNRIWMVRQERNMITRFVYFWTILTLGSFALSIIIGYLSTWGIANFMAELQGQKNALYQEVISFLMGIAGGFGMFLFIYKVIPNTVVKLKYAAIGALFSSISLTIAGDIFAFYVTYFSKNSVLYGAIGALPLFLTWLYICWVIILFGALLAWRFEQGYNLEKEEAKMIATHFSEMNYDQKLLEYVAPNFCLIAIYSAFWNLSKKGLSVSEIQEKIRLPRPWIQNSLELLIKENFIRYADSENEKEYFPCLPPEKVSIASIRSAFLPTHEEKMHLWDEHIDEDVSSKVKLVYLEKNPKATLSQIL